MATMRPSAWSRLTSSAFWSGRTSARTSSRPSRFATASAEVRLSPVSMMRRIPAARRSEIAAGRRLLDRVGDAEQAGRPAVDRRRRRPSGRRGGGPRPARPSGPGSIPSSRSIAGLPITTARPSTRPSTPRPVRERNDSAAGIASPRSAAAAATAAARGCSLDCSSPAASRSSSDSSWPGDVTTETTRGFPSVRVPVLSKTRVSIRSRTSSASAFFTRTPAPAPRPVPTMIDIGVARPSAHGQAMISTATALTRACASRGSGPKVAHAMNVMSATHDHARHEVGRDLVGQALDRRTGPARLADHPDDLGQHRLGADPLGPHDQGPVAVDRAADDAISGPFLDRDRLARDHRLVHGARAFEHDAVDRHLLARPDPQPIAGDDAIDRHVLLGAVVAEPPRGLGRQAQQRADGAAGLPARPQLEHLAQQDQRRDHRRGLEVDRDLAVWSRNESGKRPGAIAATTLKR